MAPRTSNEGPAVGDDTEVTLAPAPDPGDVTALSTPVPVGREGEGEGEDADQELAPGSTLGEYRVEKMIGAGGMGVVYAAVHPLIGKRAAVKILKKELCTEATTLQRFIDEARVVNEIGHPNIVDVFAFGELPDGRSYFVMELLAGESLRTRLARGPLMLSEVCSVARPLARALEAAHAKGVVHRDLKPDNVFLVAVSVESAHGHHAAVKLLDFGVAKLARSDHRLEKTATGAMVGTPQYIAPEQAKGYNIDARADIYALGGILFEMVTRRPPFVADNAMEVVAKHLMEAPVRPSTLVSGVPDELDTIVWRMLAKDPAERPTLGELVAVIDRLKALPPTAFVPRVPRAASASPVRRKLSPLPFALAGALAAAVGMFFLVRSLTSDEETPSSSELAQHEKTTAPETAPAPGEPAGAEPTKPASAATETTSTTAPAAATTSSPTASAPARTSTAPAAATTISSPTAPAPARTAPAPTKTPTAPASPSRVTTPPTAPASEPARPRPRPIETKPSKGKLSIQASHAAKLSVDGSVIGEGSAFETELPPGVHKVDLVAPGFIRYTLKVTIRAGETTVKHAQLVPALDPDKQLLEPGALGGHK